MLNLKKISLSLIFLSIANLLFAADGDLMRSNGKIYVVMAVVLTILSGLFIYVWRLDKKVSNLEKENK